MELVYANLVMAEEWLLTITPAIMVLVRIVITPTRVNALCAKVLGKDNSRSFFTYIYYLLHRYPRAHYVIVEG